MLLDDRVVLLFPVGVRSVGQHDADQPAEVKEMTSLTPGVQGVHQPAKMSRVKTFKSLVMTKTKSYVILIMTSSSHLTTNVKKKYPKLIEAKEMKMRRANVS